MEKVILTKAQAEILESRLKIYERDDTVRSAKAHILHIHMENLWAVGSVYKVMSSLDIDDLAKALYIGYEVEQTKEEKLLEIVNRYKTERDKCAETGDLQTAQFCSGKLSGIADTLYTLGIKIEGITA